MNGISERLRDLADLVIFRYLEKGIAYQSSDPSIYKELNPLIEFLRHIQRKGLDVDSDILGYISKRKVLSYEFSIWFVKPSYLLSKVNCDKALNPIGIISEVYKSEMESILTFLHEIGHILTWEFVKEVSISDFSGIGLKSYSKIWEEALKQLIREIVAWRKTLELKEGLNLPYSQKEVLNYAKFYLTHYFIGVFSDLGLKTIEDSKALCRIFQFFFSLYFEEMTQIKVLSVNRTSELPRSSKEANLLELEQNEVKKMKQIRKENVKQAILVSKVSKIALSSLKQKSQAKRRNLEIEKVHDSFRALGLVAEFRGKFELESPFFVKSEKTLESAMGTEPRIKVVMGEVYVPSPFWKSKR